jgi:hypothetical protein
LQAEDRVAKSIMFVLAVVGLAGGSVVAAQVTSVQSSRPHTRRGEVSREGNPNEVICRPVAPLLGSRLNARRMCATRAQWIDMVDNRAFARRNIEQVQQALPCNAETGCLNH